MEELYLELHFGKTNKPVEEVREILFNKLDIDKVLEIESGYGDKLVSLLIVFYGIDLIYELYEKYKNDRKIIEYLFDKELIDDKIKNIKTWSSHPITYCCGRESLEECFKMIEKIYNRNYNILLDLSEYNEYEYLLEGMLFGNGELNEDKLIEFIKLLDKYEVVENEFSIEKFKKILERYEYELDS